MCENSAKRSALIAFFISMRRRGRRDFWNPVRRKSSVVPPIDAQCFWKADVRWRISTRRYSTRWKSELSAVSVVFYWRTTGPFMTSVTCGLTDM